MEDNKIKLDNCIKVFNNCKDEGSFNDFMQFLFDVDLQLYVLVGLDTRLQAYVKESITS